MKFLNQKQGKNEEEKNTSMIAYALAGLVVIFVLFSLFQGENKETIPLSQVAKDINQEKVESVFSTGEKLEVKYKDGETEQALKAVDQPFTETLLSIGAEKEKLQQVEIKFEEDQNIWGWLTPLLVSLVPSLLILFIFWKIIKGAKGSTSAAFDFTKAKAKLFGAGGKDGEETTFEDVAGLQEAKRELKEVVDFLQTPEKYFKIGAQIPRGVLLVGPPGTGKTLLARAVANEAGVPFFSISGPEFIELFVGVGASRVRNLFSQAKKAGKAIIFIDELDSIGKARGQGLRGGGMEEREQTLNQILTEMDGFEKRSGVIVMGATNKPEALDHALLRPGRFDRRITLDLPDIKDRKKVLEIHSREKPLAGDIDLREIAERTPGFSGADLENLMNEGAILAARREKNEINQDELLESIEKVLLGPERRSHLLGKDEKKIAAFHEAGHALVAHFLPEAKKVRKVSIIARGQAAGYTLKMPEKEKRLVTKSQFLAEISTALGGYVAENFKFGEITTGAANDLRKATEIAKRLVTQFGMSSLGPISFVEQDEGLSSFEKKMFGARSYSEETARKIDKEIRNILLEGRKKTEEIMKENKEILEKLAGVLVEKETIERQEFEKILNTS